MASSSGQQGLTTWTGVDGRSSQQGHHQPIKQPPSAPAKKDRTKKLGRQDAQIRNVEYLKAELEKIPGHVEFRNSLHHSQPNPGAVRSWMFAVNFTEAYNNAVLIDGRYVKIKKCEIKLALTVGDAWLCDAERAVRILRKYGEGGTHPSEDVIKKVRCTDEKGSTKLLMWLRNWDEGHTG
jgi:hypothetical protein